MFQYKKDGMIIVFRKCCLLNDELQVSEIDNIFLRVESYWDKYCSNGNVFYV